MNIDQWSVDKVSVSEAAGTVPRQLVNPKTEKLKNQI